MTVIANRIMPARKHIIIALTGIYGIGLSRAKNVCKVANVEGSMLVKDLSEQQLESIRKAVLGYEDIEGNLRRVIFANIKKLIDLNCYRGIRHKRRLPLRGQNTKNNAKTAKKGRRERRDS